MAFERAVSEVAFPARQRSGKSKDAACGTSGFLLAFAGVRSWHGGLHVPKLQVREEKGWRHRSMYGEQALYKLAEDLHLDILAARRRRRVLEMRVLCVRLLTVVDIHTPLRDVRELVAAFLVVDDELPFLFPREFLLAYTAIVAVVAPASRQRLPRGMAALIAATLALAVRRATAKDPAEETCFRLFVFVQPRRLRCRPLLGRHAQWRTLLVVFFGPCVFEDLIHVLERNFCGFGID